MNEEILAILNNIHKNKCTPDDIRELPENGIFVFGTNPKGEHNSFAAKLGVKEFGAVNMICEGLCGRSYAIPIHKHRTNKMSEAISRLIDFVRTHQEKEFYVLPVGCGKAGMDPSFVALMFRNAIGLTNIYLPKVFIECLIQYYTIGVEISEDCQTLVRFPMHYKMQYHIPNGIRILGEESLMGCFNEIILPPSLKKIEQYAFSDMGGVDSFISIPSSVEWISDKAFECEFCSPGMIVEYQSYPYRYAKKHGITYKCIDFDEQKYLEERKNKRAKDNSENHGLSRYVEKMLRRNTMSHSYFSKQIEALPKGQIAIARNFGFVLNDDSHLTLRGTNENFHQISNQDRIVKVAAAFDGYMALTDKGQIISGGQAREFDKWREIEQLNNVADVIACEGHTAVLLTNGTVKVIDEPGGWEGVPNHNSVVKDWTNIKQVAVGYSNIMGLTKEGTLIYHSWDTYTNSHFYDNLNDVIQIDCYSHYYGTDSSMVLRADGTVVSDTFDGVETWRDIVQISVGADIAIGLKKDGTLEVADQRDTRLEIKQWRDLISIECKFFGVIGITRQGEILSLFAQT